MIICHCSVVTDRDVESALDAGARTVAEISDHCDAGSNCRGCWPAIADILAARLPEPADSPCTVRGRSHAAA